MLYLWFFLLILTLLIGYCVTKSIFNRNGGIILTPLPLVVTVYFLIFAYRPFVILILGGETLDYEFINYESFIEAIELGMLSLSVFLISFFGLALTRINFTDDRDRTIKHIDTSKRLLYFVIIGYMLTIVAFIGISFYGTALNNTSSRMSNPEEYKWYFIFIISKRLHLVWACLAIYYFFSLRKCIIKKSMLPLIVLAPFITMVSDGRGAALYLLIAYGVIYLLMFCPRINILLSLKLLACCFALGALNGIFSKIRIMVSAPNWTWDEVLSTLTPSTHFLTESTLIDLSWDYSVYDVFIRIINNMDSYLFGATNFNYLFSYIPRVIWEDKPHDHGFMLFVTKNLYGDIFIKNGSTFMGTIVGEGFLNFGVFGVILYSMIFAIFIFWIYRNAIKNRDGVFVVVYAIALPFSIQIIRGGLDSMINFVLSILLPLYVLNFITLGTSSAVKRKSGVMRKIQNSAVG